VQVQYLQVGVRAAVAALLPLKRGPTQREASEWGAITSGRGLQWTSSSTLPLCICLLAELLTFIPDVKFENEGKRKKKNLSLSLSLSLFPFFSFDRKKGKVSGISEF
jgi:hypothetical protein